MNQINPVNHSSDIYDIIKPRYGEIKVERKVEGGNPDNFRKVEDSRFMIQLPIRKNK